VKRVIFTVLLAGVASVAHAQDDLEPVRSLYAAADFDAALVALDRVTPSSSTEALDVARYRVFCLVALGRSVEADREIQSIVQRDPMYVPHADEASPRIRAAFTEVRKRVLPAVARTLYGDGKAAFDRKAFPEAVEKLEQVVAILDTPEAASQADLADLRTLATGFLDLSRSSMTVPAAAVTPVTPVPQAAAPQASSSTATNGSAMVNGSAPANTSKPGIPAPAPAPPGADSGATIEPVAVRQELPPWTFPTPQLLGTELRGVVQIEIDESGNVTSGRIVESVHALYDSVLLRAVRQWKYQPARRNGQPIKAFKMVAVVVRTR
jgi:protein TonB